MMSLLEKYRVIPRMADAGAGAGAGAGDGKGAPAAGAGDGKAAPPADGKAAAAGADGKGAPPADGKGGDPWHKPFGLDQKQVDYLDGKGVRELGGLIKMAQDFETVARDRNVVAKPDPSK